MKKSLALFLTILCLYSFAGDAGGHGGGTLARLLTYTQSELVNTLPLLTSKAVDFGTVKLNQWYAKSQGKMVSELKSLRFLPTSETVRDSFFGYETWIRITNSVDFIIEYNPDVEKYSRLVGDINLKHRHAGNTTNATPSISDVAEYLLHEMGHRYGLEEQDAWIFAQTLSKFLKFNKPLDPKACRVWSTTMPSVGPFQIVANPSKGEEDQVRIEGDFEITYKLDPKRFEFTCSVYDRRPFMNRGVLYILVTADSKVFSLSEGWGISCQ